VLLNEGGEFGPAAFIGEARWLQVDVQCPPDAGFTTLIPRQALTAAPLALALPNFYTEQHLDSPNIIGGHLDNFVSPGEVGATIGGGGFLGQPNSVTGSYGTVGGGRYNSAATHAVVSGGKLNTADYYSVVSGGALNEALNIYTTISGGDGNIVTSSYGTIGGGNFNLATGPGATIGGGGTNGTNSIGNLAAGQAATISGGYGNSASGSYSAVPGGQQNLAQGAGSLAAGSKAKALFDGDFVWADQQNPAFSATGANQFLIRAAGGVGVNTETPAAALDVAGSFRVGDGVVGTVFSAIQAGTANVLSSTSASKVVTITFPSAFTALPRFIATARNDPDYIFPDLSDTFVVSVRRLTTNYVVLNIIRIDSASPWAQQLRIDWIAWQ